jgi:Pyridoxamine 5'-phosphate oxidase
VARLAAVLGTTRSALSGAGLELPAGQQAALDRPVLDKLTASECRAYLGSSGVGRFLYLQSRGPVAIPVNYAMLRNDIVFRTGSNARSAIGAVAYEITGRRIRASESPAGADRP